VRDEGAGFFDPDALSEFFPDLATAARLSANGPQVERDSAITCGDETFVRSTGVQLSGDGHV